MKTGLLIVVSGNDTLLRTEFIRRCNLDHADTFTVNEQALLFPRSILTLLRERRTEVVAFGCIDLALQRYQFFLRLYLLFSRGSRRCLLDEHSGFSTVGLGGFLLKHVPVFLFEVFASIIVISCSFLHLFWLRIRGARR
ncbi:MAG: hypothetical protein HYW57_10305 [Ignavibacteriales bacterium]|nr:hypothetical protein [Ignavibacteriales bacterium]